MRFVPINQVSFARSSADADPVLPAADKRPTRMNRMLAGQVGDLDFGAYRIRLLLGIHNVHRQGRTGRNLGLRRSSGNRRSQCRRGAAQDQASANGSRS